MPGAMETAQDWHAEGSGSALSLLWGLSVLPWKWALTTPDTNSQGVGGGTQRSIVQPVHRDKHHPHSGERGSL